LFYLKLKNIKKFISKFTNLKVSIIFINSLSFSRFYYHLDHKNEKLKRDLKTINNIERQMINKYRYDTIYISDLINITFVSMLFKNPQFLVKFIAFQFKKLPKNKKQMKLIQLITQVIQTFSAERDEIIGLKLQFKGRINKRKRARTIKLNQGQMSLQSDSANIEYGYAKAYTKSGLIGVKL
jgi:ribosomal protein S3